MRQLVIALVLGGLVSMAGPAGAQDWRPVATLELSQGSVAAGIGFSWGSGTLTYLGQKYPVKVRGLSVGEAGFTLATAKGTVFDLKKLEEAYFQTRVLTKSQHEAILRLLTIFAQHLSQLSNELIVKQTEAESPVVARARIYIAENQTDELSLTQPPAAAQADEDAASD